jgi:hypothetical protein
MLREYLLLQRANVCNSIYMKFQIKWNENFWNKIGAMVAYVESGEEMTWKRHREIYWGGDNVVYLNFGYVSVWILFIYYIFLTMYAHVKVYGF